MQIIPQQDILQIDLNLRMSQNTDIISVRYVNWFEQSPFSSEKIFSRRNAKVNTEPCTAELSISWAEAASEVGNQLIIFFL